MTLEELVVVISASTQGIEKTAKELKGMFKDLENAADKLTGNITKSFNKTSSGISKTIKSISFVALIAGLGKFAQSALQAASDLQEWNNVVEVAFGDAAGEINKFAKQAVKQFGLSEVATKRLAGTFMAMSNGLGIATEAGSKMSIQLTGLSADMASFFNTTADKTANALQGIFTGQSRALKQYGIVLSEANLETFRMERGIRKAYSAMSEQEKVVLRYNYVLQQTKNAQGDFTRTSLSWANQMKQLTQNWTSLITTIGNGLVTVLQPVLVLLNKILSAAVGVVNALAKVFGGTGIKSISFGSNAVNKSLNGASEGAKSVATNLNDANDAAKGIAKSLAGFDELNILSNPSSGSGGSGGGGSGSGGGGGGAGDIGAGDIDSYFETYDEEGIISKFEDLANRIKELVDKSDWEGIGALIAGGLDNIIVKIQEWIEGTFEPFTVEWAGNIAEIINGYFGDMKLWKDIGETFASGFNAIIHTLNTFLETIDFSQIGEGLAEAIKATFDKIDWAGLGKYLAERVNAIFEFAAGFVLNISGLDAFNIGADIAEAINNSISEIDWDAIATSISGGINMLAEITLGLVAGINWDELGKQISETLTATLQGLDMSEIQEAIGQAVENIMNFLLEFDWEELGRTVGIALSKVDWLSILVDFKNNVIWPAWKGFWEGLREDGKNYIVSWVGEFGSWLTKSFWGPIVGALVIGSGVIAKLFGWLPYVENAILKLILPIAQLTAEFGKVGGVISWLSTFLLDISNIIRTIGLNLGQWIAQWAGLTVVITSLISSYGGLGGVIKRLIKVFKDMFSIAGAVMKSLGASAMWQIIKEGFKQFSDGLKKAFDVLGKFKPLWEMFFNAISVIGGVVLGVIGDIIGILGVLVSLVASAFGGILDIVSSFVDWCITPIMDFVNGVVEWFAKMKYELIGDPIVIDMWEGIKKVFSDAIEAVIEFVKGLVNSVIQFFVNLWNKAVEIWENIKKAISEKVQAVKQTVIEVWNNVKNKTLEVWNGLKTKVLGIWDSIKNGAKEKLDKVTGFFSETWKSIKDAWSGVKKFFSDIWDGISGSAKTAVNGVIRTLNKLSFDVPDWVPKIGGSKFGFNIPYLANGGIINRPTVAMLGEYSSANINPEIVAPQSLLQEIIRSENTELVSAIYQMTRQVVNAIDDKDLSVSIGDDAIANSANRGNNNYKRRTGKPLFSM